MQEVLAVDEPSYIFGSTDNSRAYAFEFNLSNPDTPTSVHGIIIDGVPVAVFGSNAGASGIHGRSILTLNGRGYLAVGNHIACFHLSSFSFLWSLAVDPATCLGIHYCATHNALISHGEIEISRFSAEGELLWSASGADIFTGQLELRPSAIEVTDFNGRFYRFSYENGSILS